MTQRYNAKNERIKKTYFRYLAEADGKCPSTLDSIRKSLRRFEETTSYKDFSALHYEQIIAFKKKLAQQKAERSGEPLSKGTMLATLNHLRAFFRWLAGQPGYKSRIQLSDIGYFRLSEKDTRIAKTPKSPDVPTLEQIRHTIATMTVTDEITMRNRALFAFTILTGCRDSAIISLRLKHIDIDKRLVKQDPADGVLTKFGKRIDTYFFPVGDDIRQIVVDWVRYLKEKKLYGLDAPLFPQTRVAHDGDQSFKASGLLPECWATTEPVRQIFRAAFAAAGLPSYKPHSFRHTLAHLGEKLCKTPEEWKAWSQNLGHENVLTTFTSYGAVHTYRQGEIIKGLVALPAGTDSDAA